MLQRTARPNVGPTSDRSGAASVRPQPSGGLSARPRLLQPPLSGPDGPPIQAKRIYRNGEVVEVADDYVLQSGEMDAPEPDVPFLQSVREDLQARYAHAPSAADPQAFPHLNQRATINGTERRQANIQGPQDHAALVAEAQRQGHAHRYISLQANGEGMGRISASPFGPRTEQHYRDAHNTMTSYPQEASQLQSHAAEITSAANPAPQARRQVYQALDSAARGLPPPPALRDSGASLRSIPLLTNVSEAQRSPLMAAASNLEIANQAQSENPIPFREAFGHSVSRGRNTVNMPGTIVSTGSGAVHRFAAVEGALSQNQFTPQSVQDRIQRGPRGSTTAEARRLGVGTRENLVNTIRRRFDITDVSRALQEPDPEGRQMAVDMRLRSAVNRNTLPQLGLMRHNLRPLRRLNPEERATATRLEATRIRLLQEREQRRLRAGDNSRARRAEALRQARERQVAQQDRSAQAPGRPDQ